LRMAATVVTRDPIFDWVAYGGSLKETKNALAVVPRDGLRQRFAAIVGERKDRGAPVNRLKIELDRDGFAAGKEFTVDKALKRIAFTLENRTGDEHGTGLWLSPPAGTKYSVFQDGREIALGQTGNWDYPLRAELRAGKTQTTIELIEMRAP